MLFGIIPWELALIGAAGLVGLVVAVRVMRRGLSTLEEARVSMRERIRQTEQETLERNKSTPVAEQLHLCEAALRELLDMQDAVHGVTVYTRDGEVCVDTPSQGWRVRYKPRMTHLKGVQKDLYGAGQWCVYRLAAVQETGVQETALPMENATPSPAALQDATTSGAPACATGGSDTTCTPSPDAPVGAGAAGTPSTAPYMHTFSNIDALLRHLQQVLGLKTGMVTPRETSDPRGVPRI